MSDAAPQPSSSPADWRPLIAQAVDVLWPELPDGPVWIEAVVAQESGGDPRAVSPVGAQGLMQLMPATAAEVGVTNPLDPSDNLRGGITYLRRQYEALRLVPEHFSRLAWALASYNGGRGYVVRALALAEIDRDLDAGAFWWSFDYSWRYLAHRQAELRGRFCDYRQMVHYVERITKRAASLGASVR